MKKINEQLLVLIVICILICPIFYFINNSSESKFFKKTIARMSTDGGRVKILTSKTVASLGQTFLFISDNEVIDSLIVNNKNIDYPSFRIVTGKQHDWLAIKKIDDEGTGLIRYVEEWYTISTSGELQKVLEYPSSGNISTYNKLEELNSKVSLINDSSIAIEFNSHICTSTGNEQAVEGKNCADQLKIAYYNLDNKNNYFILDSGKSQISTPELKNLLSVEFGYGAEVLQIGGVGSRITQKTAYYLDDHGYLNNPDSWVFVSFNNSADIMRVGCKEDYKLSACESDSKNTVFREEEDLCGITIQDKIQNNIRIECAK